MSREECTGSIIPTLKLDGSPAPSSGPFWLACVPLAQDEIPYRQNEISYAHALECLDEACAHEMQMPNAMLNTRVL